MRWVRDRYDAAELLWGMLVAFIGLDLGTSFIKGAVLDLDSASFQKLPRVPFPEPLPGLNSLFCEYDPYAILEIVERYLLELVAQAGECDGLVMCTQMHTMVLLSVTGEMRSNCIGWRDQRALMQHTSGRGSIYDHYLRRLTAEQRRELGNESPVGTPACFLFWLGELGVLEPELCPLTLGSFVLTRLCGSKPMVDPTNAMAYELLDLGGMRWHEGVVKELGLHEIRLPTLVKEGSIVGYLEVGGKRIPCYVPVGDYQCALLGAMLNPGDLSLNIATGSQVSRIVDTFELGSYQTRPFFEGKFANTLTHLPAGRSLNVLLDLLVELPRRSGQTISDPWKWIGEAVAEIERTDLKAKLSFFTGPCGDRGSILNIAEPNLTVGNLFRAAFQNMAENYYTCALRVWPDRSWKNLVLTGGLAQKLPGLRQAIEERFQMAPELCEVAEDTLSGLLMLALLFSGRVSSLREARTALKGALKQN